MAASGSCAHCSVCRNFGFQTTVCLKHIQDKKYKLFLAPWEDRMKVAREKSQTAKHIRHLLQEKKRQINFCMFLHHFQNHWWQRPVWIKWSRSCLAISDHKFWPASWAWHDSAWRKMGNPILAWPLWGRISRAQSCQDPS